MSRKIHKNEYAGKKLVITGQNDSYTLTYLLYFCLFLMSTLLLYALQKLSLRLLTG
jgi:hypothetical protein